MLCVMYIKNFFYFYSNKTSLEKSLEKTWIDMVVTMVYLDYTWHIMSWHDKEVWSKLCYIKLNVTTIYYASLSSE